MPVKPGEYLQILKANRNLKWRQVEGQPEGVTEAILFTHTDGSYSHLLRVRRGVEFFEPAVHDFYEEAYYIQGEMFNKTTKRKVKSGAYVFHRPGEKHGLHKCLKACLILEFRYYK